MMFISFVFCIVYPIIPFYQYIYAAFLTFAFLCTLGQTLRVTEKEHFVKKKIVFLGVWFMFAIGLVGALGYFNGGTIAPYVKQITKIIAKKKYMNPYFYFTDPAVPMLVLQALIMIVPLYCMWAQFIYMRLEDTYKARWMVTWILKITICCSLMFGLSCYGVNGIKAIYNIKETKS